MLGLAKIFNFLAPYDCLSCGREGDLLCLDCLHRVISRPATELSLPPLGRVWFGADYAGMVRQVLHQYKFGRARDASNILAAILDQALPRLPKDTLVTYVPTATSRVRQRGYDQARELALVFGQLHGLAIHKLLVRHGQERQVGATRSIRRQQMTGAYRAYPITSIAGAKVLLIDDIVTTGATLQMAAAALLVAGAKSVDGLVVARKQ